MNDQLLLQMEEEQYLDELGGELIRMPANVERLLQFDWSRLWLHSTVPLLSGRQVPMACLFDTYHVCVAVQLGPHIYEAALSYRTVIDREWEHSRELITHLTRTAVVTNRWQHILRDHSVVQEFMSHQLIRLDAPANGRSSADA